MIKILIQEPRKAEEMGNEKDIHGEHYVLTIGTRKGVAVVDFWPSTGKWLSRTGKAKGYGAKNIKAYFKLSEQEPATRSDVNE